MRDFRGLLKIAQSLPPSRLRFNLIRQWLKAMRGMSKKEIGVFANSDDVIRHFPYRQGNVSDVSFRKSVFPRRSLFRGSLGFLSGGGQTGDGLLAEELEHFPKMLWQNATPVPDYAGSYGDVLNVYNARKLPGVLSGKRHIAGDRRMYGYLGRDPAYVDRFVGDPTRPVNRHLFTDGWHTRPMRMEMLDAYSDGFNATSATEHGAIETLVNSIRERPQRVYKQIFYPRDGSPGSNSSYRFYDVTPLERFYRSIPDSPMAAKDRENIQTFVNMLGKLKYLSPTQTVK